MSSLSSSTAFQPQDSLPFSQACENNKQSILAVLSQVLVDCQHVLEIGSGTGQHAVFFAAHLPQLLWQTSDVAANHAAIRQWINAYPSANLRMPVVLDLRDALDLDVCYDAIFTANTLHIISWQLVERLFYVAAQALLPKGKLCIYGPFNYQGEFTSKSNQQFDAMLKLRDPASGIRDIESLIMLANSQGFILQEDNAMPANNRLLVFDKR